MHVKSIIAFILFILLSVQTGQAEKIKLPVTSGYYVEQAFSEICRLPDEEFSINNDVLMFDADDGVMADTDSICKVKKIISTPDKMYHITWECEDVGEKYSQSMDLKIQSHLVMINNMEYIRCERN